MNDEREYPPLESSLAHYDAPDDKIESPHAAQTVHSSPDDRKSDFSGPQQPSTDIYLYNQAQDVQSRNAVDSPHVNIPVESGHGNMSLARQSLLPSSEAGKLEVSIQPVQSQNRSVDGHQGNHGELLTQVPHHTIIGNTELELESDRAKEAAGGSNVESVEQPFYVNAKQYYRILKRRYARAKLEENLKISRERRPYLHESRHKHAMRRPRGQGGRFLTAAEIAELKNKDEDQSRDDIKRQQLKSVVDKKLNPETTNEAEDSDSAIKRT